MKTQKDVVTISEVNFGAKVTNEGNGFSTSIININILERLNQFKKNEDDEKEEKQVRQLGVRLSDFTRLIVLDEYLALIPEGDVDVNITDPKTIFDIKYAQHKSILKGAKLTINRERVESVVYDTEKPKTDSDGNPIVNEDGEVQYETKKDENGKDVMTLTSYGEIEFVELKLTNAALEKAKYLAFK